ncbi:tetratricopeptide repeat protein [Algibacter sp. 2305UL17-15]|uniref:tetratricopeptide repeat-containing sensor histidine kinase n=1 Tax=Algibacter sp. 2305UL17-15 TaxID=3231268 RepID=UPI0034593AA3
MKKLTVSFPFFYACLFGCLCLIASSVNAQQSNDSINYYYKMVLNPKSTDALISGYVFFKTQKEKNLKNNNTSKALYNLRMIIIAQIDLGLIHEAESSIIEALELIENTANSDTSFTQDKIALYNSLGMVYRRMNEYEKAIEIYNKAFKIVEKDKDRVSLFNNKGNIYKYQGNFILAEQQFSLVYNERLKNDDKLLIAKALDNLGSVQGKLGKKEEGLEKMLEALRIRKEEKDVQHYYTSYKHLAAYYKDIEDTKEAKKYADLGYEAAKLYRESYLEDALPRLLELNGDDLVLEYIKINDSLQKEQLLVDKKYSSAKYNLAKAQQQAFEIELQKEKQKKYKLIYLFSGLGILLLSVFGFLSTKAKYKKEKILQVYQTETRISEKVHDEVANGLYHVMTKLQYKNTANDDVLDDLEQIYNKTRDISKENSPVDIKANYSELLNDLLLSYKTNDINVVTRNISKVNWHAVSDIRKTILYRVLQELMTNMRKHSKASLVALTFNQTKNNIEIDYKDNGIGCKLKKNTGLLNAENRIATINGTITFESQQDDGFKVKIKV